MPYAFHPVTPPVADPRFSARNGTGPTMVSEYDAMGNPTGSMVEVGPDQSSMGYWDQVSRLAKMADDGMRMGANGITFGGADRLAGFGDYVTGQAQSYDAGAKAQFDRTQKVRGEHPVAAVNSIDDAVSSAWNELAERAAGGPQAPDETPEYGGMAMNIGAGVENGIYGTIGLPADFPRMVLNADLYGINWATGADLPYLPDDHVMSSRWIGRQMGKLHPAMNPENTVAASPRERIVRATAAGVAGAIAPAAIFANIARALNLTESSIPLLKALAERAAAPGTFLNDVKIGGSAGMTSGVAQEVVPDKWKPVAGLVGAVLGGGAGALLTAPVRIGQDVVRAGPEAVEKAMEDYAKAMAARKNRPDPSPDPNRPFPQRRSTRQTKDTPVVPPEDISKYYTPEMLSKNHEGGPYAHIVTGEVFRTIEGIPLTAENVVGITNIYGPQTSLSIEQMWKLAGKLSTEPPQEVYNDVMGNNLGMAHLSKEGVVRIELNKTLHPEDIRPTLGHENGHGFDEVAMLDSDGLEHEISRNYHFSRTGKDYDESLGGVKGLVTPASIEYPIKAQEFELWAEAFNLYQMDPNAMKVRMPKTAALIRTLNDDPDLSKIMQWNSVLPPILLGGAGYETIARGDEIKD